MYGVGFLKTNLGKIRFIYFENFSIQCGKKNIKSAGFYRIGRVRSIFLFWPDHAVLLISNKLNFKKSS